MSRRRGHNEGSIQEIRDENGKVVAYRAHVTIPESGRKSLPRVRSKKEAQRQLDQAKLALYQGRLSASTSQTLAKYADGWLETVRNSIKSSTYHAYKLNLGRSLPSLGSTKLDALKPAHVQDCYNQLLSNGVSPRTVRHTHTALHKALNDAVRLDLVPRNVTDSVTLPRVPHIEMSWYTAEELDKLFQSTTGERLHALWVVLGTTGLRLGEALGLKWQDIDLRRRTLQVQRTLQREREGGGLVFTEPKSKRSLRTVDLSEEACIALAAHQERQNVERRSADLIWQELALVFPSEVGTPLEQGRVHKHWSKAVEKAGIPRYRIHDLRHTMATLLIMAGMNIKTVSDLLGHGSASFTLEVYGHVAPSSRREAASLIDALLQAGRQTD